MGCEENSHKYHVMVGVVPGLPYRYVMEHMVVCSENIVHLGPHLPFLPVHAPCPPVLLPGFAAREEVCDHVFEAKGCHIRSDILPTVIPFRRYQVGIKVTGHQQCCPAEGLANGIYDALNSRGVVRGYSTNHYELRLNRKGLLILGF